MCALALISVFTDIVFAAEGEKNYVTVAVIAVMVLVSGVLRFVQESRGSAAAEKLASMIRTTATVLRGGEVCEVPVSELAVGDEVRQEEEHEEGHHDDAQDGELVGQVHLHRGLLTPGGR